MGKDHAVHAVSITRKIESIKRLRDAGLPLPTGFNPQIKVGN